MCSCLALTTPNYLCGGDEWESLHVLPEPRPTISTGRSLTDIGGVPLTERHADARGPHGRVDSWKGCGSAEPPFGKCPVPL